MEGQIFAFKNVFWLQEKEAKMNSIYYILDYHTINSSTFVNVRLKEELAIMDSLLFFKNNLSIVL